MEIFHLYADVEITQGLNFISVCNLGIPYAIFPFNITYEQLSHSTEQRDM